MESVRCHGSAEFPAPRVLGLKGLQSRLQGELSTPSSSKNVLQTPNQIITINTNTRQYIQYYCLKTNRDNPLYLLAECIVAHCSNATCVDWIDRISSSSSNGTWTRDSCKHPRSCGITLTAHVQLSLAVSWQSCIKAQDQRRPPTGRNRPWMAAPKMCKYLDPQSSWVGFPMVPPNTVVGIIYWDILSNQDEVKFLIGIGIAKYSF